MPHANSTKLTRSVTVARYRELEKADNRVALGQFIVERFHERYFEPTVDHQKRHGFTLMAISCLVIEALECFYQGEPNSKGKTRAMFESFFKNRPTGLEVFGGGDDWFYYNIRCGILHQAETTGGWRVRRTGRLLDTAQRSINAKMFVVRLRAAVANYAMQLQIDNDLWEKFRTKMDAVCKNCEAPA